MRRSIATATATALLTAGLLAGCGDAEPDGSTSGGTSGDSSSPNDDSGGGSGGGTLTLGGETITFSSARCYLEEQDSAAGGGKILFTGQGMGANAAGEDVLLDVSRYDEDSMFAGDDISVSVGDVMSGEAATYSAGTETGTITLEGSTMSADAVPLTSDDDGSQVEASFEITC